MEHPDVKYRNEGWFARHWAVLVAGGVSLVLLVLLGAVGFWWLTRATNRAEDLARQQPLPALVEGQMEMNLPKEDPELKKPKKAGDEDEFPADVTVKVRAKQDGTISELAIVTNEGRETVMDGGLAELKERLTNVRNGLQQKTNVKVHGDGKLKVKELMKVMDACRQAGFSNVSMVPPDDCQMPDFGPKPDASGKEPGKQEISLVQHVNAPKALETLPAKERERLANASSLVFASGRPMDLTETFAWLRKEYERLGNVSVLVCPNGDLEYGELMKLMHAVKTAGFTRLKIHSIVQQGE